MNLAHILHEQILPRVDTPSRYLGNEVNAVRVERGGAQGAKDPDTAEVRLALAFPDLYDIGLGNLGIHILYAALNALPWAVCERVFAPGKDMERELRERGLGMFGLESKDTLDEFDGIGFTLQSELTFTNILNLIDLAGMPLRTSDRRESDPLTFAGGPAVFNPEPLAPFMDFFVIGDGEGAIVEIAEVLRRLRGRPRVDRLRALSCLRGVYVPELYPMETLADGRIVPALDGPPIRKRLTRDLDGATFPTDYIVPFTKQVHDRISLEVLRGCTQGCRFCQAGMVTRPVRERSLENVDALLTKTLDNTGYEEVSLVSLSTCDYSRVRQLVENTVETARPRHVSVSLPSLRLDSFSVDLSDMVAETRRSGITFAPEAASPRLRALINKWIPDEDLLEMSAKTYGGGWDVVKLYFMIGLPTERDDDIHAIADLAIRTWRVGKGINGRARVNLGVSTFVPKPFTPFQWCAQIDHGETARRQDVLSELLRPFGQVKFGRHDPEETFLEGLVSRSDRRAADLIEAAFRLGCRFDAWREHLRFDLWEQAVAETGFDVADALRERSLDERLPWDHIDVLIPKSWFVEDYERAMELKHAEDCRHRKCHKCGVIDEERELCATMLRDNVKARPLEAAWERKPDVVVPASAAVQRAVFRIARTGPARFLSHLESMNAWIRALRRARAPLAYSQGFHPHPKVAFSAAMPQNEESSGEYMDVSFAEPVELSALWDALKGKMPEGFDTLGAWEVDLGAPSLMSLVGGGDYAVVVPESARARLAEAVPALLALDSWPVERKVKKKKQKKGGRRHWGPPPPRTRMIDLKPHLVELAIRPEGDGLTVRLATVDGRGAKIRELLGLLGVPEDGVVVYKRDTLWRDADGQLVSMSDWAAAAAPALVARAPEASAPEAPQA